MLVLVSSTQQSVIETHQTEILSFLRQSLHTSDIQLRLDVQLPEVKVQSYTPEGKYKDLVARNASVARLQQLFEAKIQ